MKGGILPPIEYDVPAIHGLDVIDPPAEQAVLSWIGWDDAVAAQDDTGQYATRDLIAKTRLASTIQPKPETSL